MNKVLRALIDKYYQSSWDVDPLYMFDETAFLEQFNDDNYLHLKYSKISPNDLKEIHRIIYENYWTSDLIIHDNMFKYQADKVILPHEFLYQHINTINKYISIHGPVNVYNLILSESLYFGKLSYKIVESMQHIFPTIIEEYLNKYGIENELWLKLAFAHIFKKGWCDQYLLLLKYAPTYKINNEARYITNIDIANHAIDNDLLSNAGLIYLLDNFEYSIDLINRIYIQGKLSQYNIIEPKVSNISILYYRFKTNSHCIFAKYVYYACWYLNLKNQCKYLLELDNNIVGLFDRNESVALIFVIIRTYLYKDLDNEFGNDDFVLEIKKAVDDNRLPMKLEDISYIHYDQLDDYIDDFTDQIKKLGFDDFFLKF